MNWQFDYQINEMRNREKMADANQARMLRRSNPGVRMSDNLILFLADALIHAGQQLRQYAHHRAITLAKG